MLRIISQRTLDTGEDMCASFIDWQKAFNHVHYAKFMQILKVTSTDLRERRLIGKLYDWIKGKREAWRLEKELHRDTVGHQFSSTYTANTLPRKIWKYIQTCVWIVLLLLLLLLLLLYDIHVSVTGLFFLVLLLNQRWSPPLRLQASHCSTFRYYYYYYYYYYYLSC